MKQLWFEIGLVLAASIAMTMNTGMAQIPVYVSHKGDDEVGKLLTDALKRELSKSAWYQLALNSDSPKNGTKDFIYLASIDVAGEGKRPGWTSAVSVVIEAMMRGNWPVPQRWYHKIILVRRQQADEVAKRLLADMHAHECRTWKSSPAGCPEELFR